MTALAQMHPEDIKSALRKQFGTAAAFERAHHLPAKSVSDHLRGKRSQRVEDAIKAAISFTGGSHQSELSESSTGLRGAHRQNAGAN